MRHRHRVRKALGKRRPGEDLCESCPERHSRTCRSEGIVRLSDYKPGQKGTIVQVCGEPEFRLRLMEMGFVKGVEVKVIKYAPLTDPIEFVIRGYHITLRRDEAADILMNEPHRAA